MTKGVERISKTSSFLRGLGTSLVPRPNLTAFFATMFFATATKKAVREGLGMRL